MTNEPGTGSRSYLVALRGEFAVTSERQAEPLSSDDLVTSGETHLIESDSLRLALAFYTAQLEQLRHADEQAWTTWEQRIQLFLESRIPRVDRLRRGTFGAALGELPFGPSPHPTDWVGVFRQCEFESMLAERWMRLSIAAQRFDAVLRITDEIVRLTDRRWEDR